MFAGSTTGAWVSLLFFVGESSATARCEWENKVLFWRIDEDRVTFGGSFFVGVLTEEDGWTSLWPGRWRGRRVTGRGFESSESDSSRYERILVADMRTGRSEKDRRWPGKALSIGAILVELSVRY